jgi:alkylation response protein AidB-like acyl-CoA dehydrogenase
MHGLMQEGYGDEQRLLSETLNRFLTEQYTFEDRRKMSDSGEVFNRKAWRSFAELGLLAMPFETRYGGLESAGGVDALIVMQAFGRALVLEPYLPCVILSGGLLSRAGSEELKADLIPKIIAGETVCTTAFAEPGSRYNLASVAVSARRRSGSFVINGTKAVVFGAPSADQLFVTARTSGAPREVKGITIFAVPVAAAGLTRRDYRTVDGMAASELEFRDVAVPDNAVLGTVDEGFSLIEQAVDQATAGVCAEAAGIMEALCSRTQEYVRERIAFGRRLADFQVIRHRLVDMRIAFEYASAASLKAAEDVNSPYPRRAMSVSAAKAIMGREAGTVGRAAVQLHGAMGITNELDVGHYFKRLTAIQISFGNTDYHLRRLARFHSAEKQEAETHNHA